MNSFYLITGASSGIGYALACNLARQNKNILAVARNKNKLQQLQEKFPEHIHIFPADLAEPKSRESLINYISQQQLTLMGLINNAGAAEPVCLIQDLHLKDWHQQMAINVDAPVFLSQQLVPYLQSNSRIINITTGAASSGIVDGLAAYAMSKTALNIFTRYLSAELASKNIFVTAAHPGIVKTEIVKSIANNAAPGLRIAEFQEIFEREGKYLDADLSAKFLSWLLLEADNSLYTGEIIGIYNKKYQSQWHDQPIPSPYPDGIEPP